jgi:hypothetical protein
MGYRSNILDAIDFKTCCSDTANCGFTTCAGSFDTYFDFFHTHKLSFFGSITGDDLCCISCAFA